MHQAKLKAVVACLQSLAETAMLAAVSGLGYTLATLLKLDSYLGYFLPLPVIIAAMRSGPAAARKTVTATCFLLICKLALATLTHHTDTIAGPACLLLLSICMVLWRLCMYAEQ